MTAYVEKKVSNSIFNIRDFFLQRVVLAFMEVSAFKIVQLTV